ncbi:hypothetical protein [Streptomyces sp. NPDC056669]|uniref:hypothetical protein n=1 Tax=Streptomyces sp. NPDC056669 TaxID=3345903 RepID=UPI0036A17766
MPGFPVPGSPAPRTARSPRTSRFPRTLRPSCRAPRPAARGAALAALVAVTMALGGCMSIADDPERPDKHRGSHQKGDAADTGGAVVRSDGRGRAYEDSDRDKKDGKGKKGEKRKDGEDRSASASATDPEADPSAPPGKHGAPHHGPAPTAPPQPGGATPSDAPPAPRPTSPPPSAPDPKPTDAEPPTAPASPSAQPAG